MTVEEQIAALNKKIDDYNADDVKKSQLQGIGPYNTQQPPKPYSTPT